MGSRPSLRYFVLCRLDSLMAINQSRHEAKHALREGSAEKRWSISTGRIHSHTTRKVYQQHILAFVTWAEATYQVKKPAELDLHADEWVSQYLRERLAQGKRPATLHTERSALRLFFGPHIAASVQLPTRQWKAITRSRVPVKQDAHFQPEHWPDHLLFAHATGLRRSEMRDLRIHDIGTTQDGHLVVFVRRGKGGKSRDVPVLEEDEQAVRTLIEGRDPNEHLFAHIPKNMDVQSYRRDSAQKRSQQASGRPLPERTRRLKPSDYDAAATQQVSEALGHRRRSIVLNHYIR